MSESQQKATESSESQQRVEQLEETLRRIMKILEPHARAYTPAAYAYHEAYKVLNGGPKIVETESVEMKNS